MNLSIITEEHYVNNPPHVVTLCKVLEKVSKSLPDADKSLLQLSFSKKGKCGGHNLCCAVDDTIDYLQKKGECDAGVVALILIICASIRKFKTFLECFDQSKAIDEYNRKILLQCCLILNEKTDIVTKEMSPFMANKKKMVQQLFEDNIGNDHHSTDDVWICFVLDCLHQLGEQKYVKKLQRQLEEIGKSACMQRPVDESGFLSLKSWDLRQDIGHMFGRWSSAVGAVACCSARFVAKNIHTSSIVNFLVPKAVYSSGYSLSYSNLFQFREAPEEHSVYIPPGDTSKETYRISTFFQCPDISVDVNRLASAGFFYTGYKDRSKCFSCGICIEEWLPDDDPASSRWHKDDCKMLLGEDCGNIPLASPHDKLLQSLRNHKTAKQSHQSLLQTLNLCVEADRIKSFISWSAKTIQPSELAHQGFFYLGHSDRVQCFSCLKVFSHWNYGDSVAEAHSAHSQLCKMVREVEERNIPIPEDQKEIVSYVIPLVEPPDVSENEQKYLQNLYPLQTPRHPDMKNVDRRFATFSNRWPNNEGCPSPRKISDAGFFYIGPDQRVQCWYCGGIMECWNPGEEAWTEHAKYFPTCNFVLQRKGLDFVNHILSLFPNMDLPSTASPSEIDTDESVQLQIPYAPSTSSITTANVETEENLEQRLHKAMSAAVVTNAIKLGLEQTKVEQVVRSKLSKNLHYSSVEAILDDVWALPSDHDANEIEAGASAEAKRLKELEAKVEQHAEAKKCKVCLDKTASIALVPCGHFCCFDCASKLQNCPVCRTKIEKTLQTYMC